MVPFIEGEGAAAIGVVGGIHPVVSGVAAATGNLLALLGVVVLSSRARAAALNRLRPGLLGAARCTSSGPNHAGLATAVLSRSRIWATAWRPARLAPTVLAEGP